MENRGVNFGDSNTGEMWETLGDFMSSVTPAEVTGGQAEANSDSHVVQVEHRPRRKSRVGTSMMEDEKKQLKKLRKFSRRSKTSLIEDEDPNKEDNENYIGIRIRKHIHIYIHLYIYIYIAQVSSR